MTNKSVSIQTNTTPAAPTLSTTNPTITKVNDNIDISVAIGLNNASGFVYGAIGTVNQTTPTITDIQSGANLVAKGSAYAP